MAPRYLNAPPVCRFSHLKNTCAPTRASNAAERMTGVRTMCGPMRAAAATTSANSGDVHERSGIFRREEMLAVVRELADGFLDVGERLVFALLRKTRNDPRRPAARQLLERAHVEIAVVEELLERRHVAREEAAVLADAVAAHRRGIGLDQQRSGIRCVRFSALAIVYLLVRTRVDEPGRAVRALVPLVHGVEDFVAAGEWRSPGLPPRR